MEYSSKEIQAIAAQVIALSEKDQGDESNILYARTVAALNEEQVAEFHSYL